MLAALIGALIIGATLGLLGSGGSILTVPVLVLLLERPDKLAIAEALAIVGSVAVFAATPYALHRQVHWKSVLFFGLAGMLGAYLGARGACYCPSTLQMILFGLVMFAAAWMMILGAPEHQPGQDSSQAPSRAIWKLMLEGLCVGALTGLIGIGGGFLIVPALVLLSRLPMRIAVGTSLVIIAMNAFTGFSVHWFRLDTLDMHVDWEIIVTFAAVGILGSLMGSFLGLNIPQARLKRAFGFFVIPMSLYILGRELLPLTT